MGLLALMAKPALAQEPGWREVDGRVHRILADYYDPFTDRSFRGSPGLNGCLADEGDLCFGGDHEDQLCGFVPVCRTEDEISGLLEDLRSAAEFRPESAYAMGQAVYAFARVGRFIEAFELAENCQAVDWWCALLQGLVLQRSGQPERAADRFEEALEHADPEFACQLKDLGPLLSWGDRRRYQLQTCSSRDDLDARFWWLADPFFAMAGNDRWTEHVRRRFELVLHEQLLAAHGATHPGSHETAVVRRGWEDSWLRGPHDRFVSRSAARYHFVAEGGAFSDSLKGLAFRLEAQEADEGFTPTYGPVVSIPIQVARFRQRDSMLVAVAGTLSGSLLSTAPDATAYLILSDGPRSFPLQLASPFSDGRVVFLAEVLPQVYVASYEVLSADGMGRNRSVLQPLRRKVPVISDLLLFRPVGRDEPDSLLTAAGMMLGETSVEARDPLGVYWETYGAKREEVVRIEMEVRREGGGLLDGVRRLFLGSGEGRTGRLAWEEPSPGEKFRNSAILDLKNLPPGRYVLFLRVSWPGQDPLQTERAFQIR